MQTLIIWTRTSLILCNHGAITSGGKDGKDERKEKEGNLYFKEEEGSPLLCIHYSVAYLSS